MAYSRLTQNPLPNLTIAYKREMAGGLGCADSLCHHGMGDDSDGVDLSDLPLAPDETYQGDPGISTQTIDLSQLPLAPTEQTLFDYPTTVGTQFISNGDGTYTNIQTAQSVPYSTAVAVTAATTGAASTAAQAQAPIESNSGISALVPPTLVDPSTGTNYSTAQGLSSAAQVLQAAGNLYNAANGQLTAAGIALAQQGGLVAAAPSASASLTSGLNSLTSWFSGTNAALGVPNSVLVIGGAIGLLLLSGKKRRR